MDIFSLWGMFVLFSEFSDCLVQGMFLYSLFGSLVKKHSIQVWLLSRYLVLHGVPGIFQSTMLLVVANHFAHPAREALGPTAFWGRPSQ